MRPILERASVLNHPKLWEIVMAKYPDLKINFAHFGGSTQLMNYVKYVFDPKGYKKKDYDAALNKLTDARKLLAEESFEQRKNKMHFKENLSFEERKELWNAFYHAGLIDNWAKAIFEIVRKPEYKNAFVDVSCFSTGELVNLVNDNTEDKVFTIRENLIDFKVSFFDNLNAYEKSKILYGSDYFLLQFFGPEMDQYIADFQHAFGDDFKIIAGNNPKTFLG